MANQYTERESERYGRRSEGSRGWGQERGHEGRDYEERGRFDRASGDSRYAYGDESRGRGYDEGRYGEGRYSEGRYGSSEDWRGEGSSSRSAYPRESERGGHWSESDFEHGGRGYGRESAYGREGGYGREGEGWQARSYSQSGWGGERGMSEDWSGVGGNRSYGYEGDGGTRGSYGERGWSGSSSETGYRERSSWASQQGPYVGRGPQGYKRSDERITEDVNECLTRHGQIDASEIQVSVRDGEVTLSGTVNSRQAKRLAEDAAEACSGVKEVQNQLRVKQDEQGSNAQSEQKSRTSASGQQSRTSSSGQSQTEQKRSSAKASSR